MDSSPVSVSAEAGLYACTVSMSIQIVHACKNLVDILPVGGSVSMRGDLWQTKTLQINH